MEINKQLFEDILSGKLKGKFVFRDGRKCNSYCLYVNHFDSYSFTHPYCINGASYRPDGTYSLICEESESDVVDFIPDTNMKENKLTIEIPDGKIVDWDESKKQNKIVLKDKQLTYRDVCKKLFENKESFYIHSNGYVASIRYDESDSDGHLMDSTNASSEHQLECILAKNKLANVAVYLNDGWKPSKGNHVFTIMYYGDCKNKLIISEHYFGTGENLILFKTQKDAKQAIEILGEEIVKLALEPLGI
jgi:hypothetical protein